MNKSEASCARNVRSQVVLGSTNAMFFNIVIAVAANMVATVDYERGHPKLFGATLSDDCARKPTAHYQQVYLVWCGTQVATNDIL